MKLAEFRLSPRLRIWLWGLFLVIATVMTYQPAWNGKLIWDDAAYLTASPVLTAPDALRRIWFSLESPSQYFPLTYTSFYLERLLWGPSPMGCHIVNLLLHAANVLLLWRLLARLRVPGAWLAAGIFALHPVQVESVAWIAERKNVLMGFFFLLALLQWVRFIDEKTLRPWRCYILALVFHALALSAKTTACMLPAALLLILWLKKTPVGWRRLAQVAPFAGISAGMGLVTIWWERFHQGTQGQLFAMGAVDRLLVASRAVWFYAGKLLWPANLTFSYPRWKISASDAGAYGWIAAMAILGLVIWRARRWTGRSVEVAAVFFVATLSPVLGFVMLYTFKYSFVADHYQYLACIGPIALAAAAMEMGLGRMSWGKPFLRPALCIALLLTLGTLTWRQSRMYTDMETLWRTTLERNPDCWMAQNDLGAILYEKGQADQAIILFRKSLEIEPGNAETHNNLGAALDKKGQLDEAIAQFQKAVAIRPDFAEAYRNLGDVLLRKGRVDEAILQFQEAVAIRPDIAKAHHNLADALLQKGRVDEAILQFQEMLKIQPEAAGVHYNLGLALLQKGRLNEAAVQFQKEATIRPDLAEAHNNLGYCLIRAGRADEAVAPLRKALEIHPDYAEAHYNLGNAFLQKKADRRSHPPIPKIAGPPTRLRGSPKKTRRHRLAAGDLARSVPAQWNQSD
jgi:Flp pilus assembly protein TadD